jgi:hypothetical protein
MKSGLKRDKESSFLEVLTMSKEKKQFIPIGSEVYTSKGSKGRVVRLKKNILGQVNFYVKDNVGNVEKFGRDKVSRSRPKGVDVV